MGCNQSATASPDGPQAASPGSNKTSPTGENNQSPNSSRGPNSPDSTRAGSSYRRKVNASSTTGELQLQQQNKSPRSAANTQNAQSPQNRSQQLKERRNLVLHQATLNNPVAPPPAPPTPPNTGLPAFSQINKTSPNRGPAAGGGAVSGFNTTSTTGGAATSSSNFPNTSPTSAGAPATPQYNVNYMVNTPPISPTSAASRRTPTGGGGPSGPASGGLLLGGRTSNSIPSLNPNAHQQQQAHQQHNLFGQQQGVAAPGGQQILNQQNNNYNSSLSGTANFGLLQQYLEPLTELEFHDSDPEELNGHFSSPSNSPTQKLNERRAGLGGVSTINISVPPTPTSVSHMGSSSRPTVNFGPATPTMGGGNNPTSSSTAPTPTHASSSSTGGGFYLQSPKHRRISDSINRNVPLFCYKIAHKKEQNQPSGTTGTSRGNRRIRKLIAENIDVKLGNMIGKGSHGTVYEARREDTGQIIACKITPVDHPEALKAMKKEVDLLQRLNHPNCINFLGTRVVFTDNENNGSPSSHGQKFIHTYLEFIPGGTISDLVQTFGRIEDKFLLRSLTYQVTLGLQYLHKKGVVHRDLKGSNVLLTVSGEAILSDMGTAFIAGSKNANFYAGATLSAFQGNGRGGNNKRNSLTIPGSGQHSQQDKDQLEETMQNLLNETTNQLGQSATILMQTMCGSIPWMAPEVLTGNNTGQSNAASGYKKTADIWSLGGLIIEMASGSPPWSEKKFDNPIALMMALSMGKGIPGLPEDNSALGEFHFNSESFFEDEEDEEEYHGATGGDAATISPGAKFLQDCFHRDAALRPSCTELLDYDFIRDMRDLHYRPVLITSPLNVDL
ncbi:unnamed protein product [Amoebophrya sp. A120]|nr:unnamed protein product [Amoebophrya sp. A120]|eukprot:GSA120T00023917001.1